MACPVVSKPDVSLLSVLTLKVRPSGPVIAKVAPGEPEHVAETLTAVAVTFELTPACAAVGNSTLPATKKRTVKSLAINANLGGMKVIHYQNTDIALSSLTMC
jgi:hypothetical protein